ncbi:unnamed protein product [Auanema sp. JU1783]|nr:unnamed protein product [Auanema sp. JU1783]
MSAAVASAPVASSNASKPKVSKAKIAVKSLHPSYLDMIKKAIGELKGKSGSSKPAILKYVLANFQVGDNIIQVNSHLRVALKRGVAKGDFKQVKGTGASGSFKLGEKKPTPKIIKKVVAKKPAVKKTKAATKSTTEKKAKSPKKAAAKSKSEKTEKKPKAEKKSVKEKKAKSTKKVAAKPKTEKKAKAPKKAVAKPKAKKAAEPKA